MRELNEELGKWKEAETIKESVFCEVGPIAGLIITPDCIVGLANLRQDDIVREIKRLSEEFERL